MLIGFDADQDCSAVAALAKARGASFCCRYLKNLTAHEAIALSNAGLQIVSIFESTAQRALMGAAAGTEDGTNALDQAAALLQPKGSAIYATADFDEQTSQDRAVIAYFAAFKVAISANAKLGVYGNGALCQALLDAGVADYTWLAGGSGMRGTMAFLASGRATLVQDVGDKRDLNLGISIDSDGANTDDFGSWSLAAHSAPQVTAPVPQAAPTDGSEETAEDLNADELQSLS